MKNTELNRNSDDSYFDNNLNQLIEHFNEKESDEIMKKKSVQLIVKLNIFMLLKHANYVLFTIEFVILLTICFANK